MKFPILLNIATNEVIKIDKPIFQIGREENSADYAIDNTMVSRTHCTILTKDGGYYVVDKNSTNRTYIDGICLDHCKEYPLHACSVLQLANSLLVFIFSESEEQ